MGGAVEMLCLSVVVAVKLLYSSGLIKLHPQTDGFHCIYTFNLIKTDLKCCCRRMDKHTFRDTQKTIKRTFLS